MSATSRDGLLAVLGSMTGLTTISVGLRFLARRHQNLPLKADDAFAIVSWAGYIVAAGLQFYLVGHYVGGAANGQKATIPAERSDKLQITWDIFVNINLACTKLSALFFYRRIFCVGRKGWFDHVSLVTIAVVSIWGALYCFLEGFACGTHLSALWTSTAETLKYCKIQQNVLISFPICDFILDLWILALPIPRIMQLHATISKKLSIIGVFLLAFIGLGASLVRMIIYVQIKEQGAEYYLEHSLQRTDTEVLFTAMLEMGMSLVAVNIPSMWLLFSHVVPEKVTRGLRSMTSLSSLSSKNSGTYRKQGSVSSSRPSESSHVYGDDIEAQNQKTEVYAVPGNDKGVPDLPANSIKVENSVSFRDDKL